MDSGKSPVRRFDWLPAHMPRVAALVAERRRELGDVHVNECWRRGVLEQLPGWFFAREAGLAVGTPFGDDKQLATFQHDVRPGEALLVIRPLEA